ncbi:MAG: type II toxin-antitoxin system VapC family toxin [Acidimicrobiales bacterium]
MLVDTSVAVALVVIDHDYHASTVAALQGRRLGLAGHAAFETFSVLTRLPAPLRRSPRVVSEVVRRAFEDSRFLGEEASARLLGRVGDLGISGGAIYDALVGATAVKHGLVLATRDERAAGTYRLLGVETLSLS